MTKDIKELIIAMHTIVNDIRAKYALRIEAAKVIAACRGILLPDTGEGVLSTRQAIELRQAKQEIGEKMARRKERKRLENRRHYLKRKLRQGPPQPPQEPPTGSTGSQEVK